MYYRCMKNYMKIQSKLGLNYTVKKKVKKDEVFNYKGDKFFLAGFSHSSNTVPAR